VQRRRKLMEQTTDDDPIKRNQTKINAAAYG
jgi:hypothetical protein